MENSPSTLASKILAFLSLKEGFSFISAPMTKTGFKVILDDNLGNKYEISIVLLSNSSDTNELNASQTIKLGTPENIHQNG